jgi:cell division protein FtsN
VTVVVRAVFFAALFAVGFVIGFHSTQRRAVDSPPAVVPPASTPAASPRTPREPTPVAVRSPAPAPLAVTPPPAATSGYRVQVGAFRNRVNADNLAAALRREGFAANVAPGALFRVVVGPYASQDLARHAAARLHGLGYPAIVIPAR